MCPLAAGQQRPGVGGCWAGEKIAGVAVGGLSGKLRRRRGQRCVVRRGDLGSDVWDAECGEWGVRVGCKGVLVGVLVVWGAKRGATRGGSHCANIQTQHAKLTEEHIGKELLVKRQLQHTLYVN